MLNKLLGGYAAVRIENHEEFEKVKEILAIKNCFLANKEPVAKMSYPGDVVLDYSGQTTDLFIGLR